MSVSGMIGRDTNPTLIIIVGWGSSQEQSLGGSFQSKGDQTKVGPWNLGLSSGLLAYQLGPSFCEAVLLLGDVIKNTVHDPESQVERYFKDCKNLGMLTCQGGSC